MSTPTGPSIAARVDAMLSADDPSAGTNNRRAKMIRSLMAGLSAISVFCTITGTLLAVWAIGPTTVGWKPTAIVSESMAPSIRRGDIVVFREHNPDDVLDPGAVIRYDDTAGRPTVHRVVDVAVGSTEVTYTTKGDANGTVDSTPVSAAGVSEVGAIVVPLMGWPPLWKSEGNYLALAVLVVGAFGVLGMASQTVGAALRPGTRSRLGPLGARRSDQEHTGLLPADLRSRLDLPTGSASVLIV